MVCLRLLLGGLFLYAAASKWAAPRAFAEDVANYRLLPSGLVPVFTVSLLGIETLVGAQLVLGVLLREAALLCTGLMLAFSVAVASALLRHLKIDCGCFGAGTSPATVMTLVRDLGLLGLSGLLLWLSSLSSARR